MTFLEKIKDLRERTGAGMLDCKKFLLQANDDLDEAVRLLHVAGFKPKAGRISAEGAVFEHTEPSLGVGSMVEINCETDFVALTEDFKSFGRAVAQLVTHGNPENIEVLRTLAQPALDKILATTKESIIIRRFVRYEIGSAP